MCLLNSTSHVMDLEFKQSVNVTPASPTICRLLYSVTTAVDRGWVSHSFPRPVIAGKGVTLSFSQWGNHSSLHTC